MTYLKATTLSDFMLKRLCLTLISASIIAGVLALPSEGQAPAPGGLAPASAPKAKDKAKSKEKAKEKDKDGDAASSQAKAEELPEGMIRVSDITNRYRFLERYNKDATQNSKYQIGQYRVASKYTIKTMIDRPEGAPDRSEGTTQVIYTERPSYVSVSGQVTRSVRQYEKIRVSRSAGNKVNQQPTTADGLVVWYETRVGEPPLVLSLSPNRRLGELEYQIATTQLFTPDLMGVLPTAPSRIGDTWRVSRAAAQALLGERQIRGDNLVGKFTELRKDTKTGNFMALLTIQGKVANQAAETAVNAQVVFQFPPPPPPTEAEKKKGDAALAKIEAQGSITDLRMGMTTTVVIPNSKGLKQTDTRELVLQRKPAYDAVQLQIPKDAPPQTPENSWIITVDANGRFQFRHPQTLLPETNNDDPDSMVLRRSNPEGPDVLVLKFSPENENQEDMYKKLLNEWGDFRAKGFEIREGTYGYLPESDWPDMKVYHAEAAMIIPSRGSSRTQTIYNNYYLIRFKGKGSLTAHATTMKDPPLAFRRGVEEILKTYRLGTEQTQK